MRQTPQFFAQFFASGRYSGTVASRAVLLCLVGSTYQVRCSGTRRADDQCAEERDGVDSEQAFVFGLSVTGPKFVSGCSALNPVFSSSHLLANQLRPLHLKLDFVQ